ncbi:sugar phosphate isomerase/epimerase family protein [Pseudomonas sp. SIMBA_059]
MRLAVSNIAWDVSEDKAIAALLHRYAIDAIDIAPGKYFPNPIDATTADIFRVKKWWADRDIEITGMQALLFGTTGLNVFGSEEDRAKLQTHLAAVCRIGAELGASRVVFGSPKNRDRTGLDDAQAAAIALPFFRKLADVAQALGVTVCLEPNPEHYGANFMTDSSSTAAVVKQLAHPALRMQLDTGALTINGEDPRVVLHDYAALIGHVHLSEPDLVPLGDGDTAHQLISRVLSQYLPENVLTIEMVATTSEPHEVSIERSIQVAQQHYHNLRTGADV